jgi:D-glycero-D-manno-heptose 1,7-bisphosphate phosphatase
VTGDRSALLRRAVFLDRDGTVNVERGYVHRPSDFDFIPGAPEAIRLLRDAGFLVIVISNQSGVARGYYSEEDVAALHRHMDRELGDAGTEVDAYYFCPHHPEKGVGKYLIDCGCRKPLPGMLLQAAEDFSLDLSRSYVVGDKVSDVDSALKAGAIPFLVETGHGTDEAASAPPGTRVVADLLTAAREILGGRN